VPLEVLHLRVLAFSKEVCEQHPAGIVVQDVKDMYPVFGGDVEYHYLQVRDYLQGLADHGSGQVRLARTGEGEQTHVIVNQVLDVDQERDRLVHDAEEVPEPVVLLLALGLVTDQLLDRFSAQQLHRAAGQRSVGLPFEGHGAAVYLHDISYGCCDYLDPGALGALLPFLLYQVHELFPDRRRLRPVERQHGVVHRVDVGDLIERVNVVGPEGLDVGDGDELSQAELLDHPRGVVALDSGCAEGHGGASVRRLAGGGDDLPEAGLELAAEVVEWLQSAPPLRFDLASVVPEFPGEQDLLVQARLGHLDGDGPQVRLAVLLQHVLRLLVRQEQGVVMSQCFRDDL